MINGKPYMTGPLPTVSASIQAAIKHGTNISGNGAMECVVLVWGYARENVGTRRNPIWQFVLDSSGNPIKVWTSKLNNGGKTTVFTGINEDKVLNEIAYARYNLKLSNWVVPSSGRKSNEWEGLSSEGKKINMYLSYERESPPVVLPNPTLNYGSAFPKL